MRPTDRTCFSSMLIEFFLMRIGDFSYKDGSSPKPPTSPTVDTVVAWGSQARKVFKKKKKKKNRREESPRALKRKRRLRRERKEEVGKKNVMQSGKPCRSPFVRGHASY